MAITAVQTKAIVSPSHPYTLTPDSTPSTGNLLILILFQRAGPSLSTPSGWTLSPAGLCVLAADSRVMGIYYRTSDGTESSISGLDGVGGGAAAFMEFAGADPSTVISSAEVNDQFTTVWEGGGAISPGAASEIVVIGGHIADSFTSPACTPTSPTVEVLDTTVTGGEKPSCWAAYNIVASPSGNQKIAGTGLNASNSGSSILFGASGGGGSGARSVAAVIT